MLCSNHEEEELMHGVIPLQLLVHTRAVTDPTAEHHCEDHLEDLHGGGKRKRDGLIGQAPASVSQLIKAGASGHVVNLFTPLCETSNLTLTMMTATTRAARPIR